MAPHEFLAAVLPPPGHGYYCAAELTSNKKQHVFVETTEEIDPYAQQWLDQKRDVYFALATYKEKGSRSADNAAWIRTMAIDMDGYETKKAAASALGAFLERTKLDRFGTPWIVASGGGLHCYWTFDEPVAIKDWKPVAESLKRLCKQQALSIDMSVTADAARVLRIPGTWNYKPKYPEPRPVKLLAEAVPITFSEFSQAVRELVAPEQAASVVEPLMLEGTRPSNAKPATAVKLIENSTTKFKLILDATKRGEGCGQLQYYVENAREDGMEPLWRAMLSQAKYCTDGERAATMLSKLHPYEPERMQIKLREIKGPYSCVSISSISPGICDHCEHFGKITNPLALGREIVTDNTEKVIEIPVPSHPDDEEPPPPMVVTRPAPPKGYSYGVNGGVFCERMVEEADGTKRKHQIMLLPYTLFVADLLQKDNEHTVHLVADRPGAPVDILVPQRYAVSKDELLKTLAQQNIIASFGSGNDKNLFEYLRACIEEASVQKKAIKIPQQYGWQEDESFVFNGRIFSKDGTERSVPMPDLANITRATRPKGELKEWRKFPAMLERRGHFTHLMFAGIGFGSPLMRFTQFSSLVFHIGSTDSGTGKTLALNLVNSIWGHPVRYRTGKGTSGVTMQQRMGNLNSLPFTSDEITHKSRSDPEWFPGFVFDAAEGQGKEKSEAHHNRERINTVTWSSLSLLTSNTYMHDFMSGAREHTSQGELYRMLEWTPEEKLNWTEEEEEILRVVFNHYGVAAEKYVRWLVHNADTAKRVTLETVAYLKKRWRMTGDERYWAAGCGCTIAGLILASDKYAGIYNFPVEECIDALFALVKKARKVVASGKRTAEDVLNSFTREHYGQFVVIKASNGRLLAELGSGEEIDKTITRSRVMGRVEHNLNKPGFVEYFIEEQVMKTYCVALSFGYETFKRQIVAQRGTNAVQFIRKDMMAKTRGPQMRIRAISILCPEDTLVDIEAQNAEGLPLAPS